MATPPSCVTRSDGYTTKLRDTVRWLPLQRVIQFVFTVAVTVPWFTGLIVQHFSNAKIEARLYHHHHHHHHLSLNRKGRSGTTDDFVTSFLHFFPGLHCPLGLGELQACPFPNVVFPPLPLSALPSFPFHCAFARWFWPDLMNGRHDHTTAVCVPVQWSGGVVH